MNTNPRLNWLNGSKPALVGMVHLEALPGTPNARTSFSQIRSKAIAEAQLLCEAGFDALIVENMGDTPYLRRTVPAEIIAAMTTIVTDVCGLGLPTGVQILAGANKAAMAVAAAAGADFIRAESFVFGHLADEGWMDADAGELLRYRRDIKGDVAVLCDIQKKHASHALSADIGLADWIKAADFCGADGVIITGASTGLPPTPDRLSAEVQPILPTLIGSGVTPENVVAFVGLAQGVIVGSYLKTGGHWRGDVCRDRSSRMRRAVDALTLG